MISRPRSQIKNEGDKTHKLNNYSSMRHPHRTPTNPVRRNTTRAQNRCAHAK